MHELSLCLYFCFVLRDSLIWMQKIVCKGTFLKVKKQMPRPYKKQIVINSQLIEQLASIYVLFKKQLMVTSFHPRKMQCFASSQMPYLICRIHQLLLMFCVFRQFPVRAEPHGSTPVLDF